MEVVLATISLVWVIGILTLQRIDTIIDEFVKADGYYLSLDQNGVIDQTQLNIKSLLPKTTIILFLHKLSTSEHRWDRGGLKKSLLFYKISNKIKYCFELLLIAVTLILPAIYLIDFSGISYFIFVDKSIVSYLSLLLVVIASLVFQKIMVHYSYKLYPLKIELSRS